MWGGGAESKKNKKLAERLARNLENLKKHPKQVPAGLDNRADILHEARFYPGATGKSTDVWLQARKVIGLTGPDPVLKYDFDGIGASERLNSYLIAQWHNLGSKDFSIKMMNKKAVDLARAGTSKDSSHPIKDFEDVQEVKMALVSLRGALHLIFPFCMMMEPLDIFLNSVRFGEATFGYNPPPHKIEFLAGFIDSVLRYNAEHWDDESKHMDYMEIRAKWFAEIQEKFPTGAAYTKPSPLPKQQQKEQVPAPAKSAEKAPRTNFPMDLCKNFQFGNCKQTEKSCKYKLDNRIELLHLCGYWLPEENRFCRQPNHTYTDHRKNPTLYK
jgi:hypothetical protein